MVSLWGAKSGQSVLGHVLSSSVWRQSSCCPTLAQTGCSVLHTPARQLRSASDTRIFVTPRVSVAPRVNTKTFCERSFLSLAHLFGTVGSEHSATLILPPLSKAPSSLILRTVRRTMIRFLSELLVRQTWFGQFNELYFVLNWLIRRCKLVPELAADAQQTAWSKM